MWNLIKIELKKLASKKRLITSAIAIITISILLAGFVKLINNIDLEDTKSEEDKVLEEAYAASSDWKERYEIQMEMNKQFEGVLTKDYVELQNSLIQYRIDNDIEPDENTGYDAYNFMSFVLKLGIIFVVISASIYCEVLNEEYKNKTEKLIYTTPNSRSKIIAAKYLAATIFVTLTLLLFFATAYLTGGLFFSFKGVDATEVFYFNHQILARSRISYLLLRSATVYLSAFFMGSLSFALTLLSRSRMIAMGVSSLMFLFGDKIITQLYDKGMTWTKYIFAYYSNLGKFIDNPMPKEINITTALISMFISLALIITAGIV